MMEARRLALRGKALRLPLALATLLVALSAIAGEARPDRDRRSEGFGLPVLFPLLYGMPRFPEPMALQPGTGGFATASTLTWSNYLRYDDRIWSPDYYVLVDGESLQAGLEGRMGLPAGLTLRLLVSASYFYPGILDPAISGFHHLLGLPNYYRDVIQPNQLVLNVQTPAGPALAAGSSYVVDIALEFAGLDWSPAQGSGLRLGLRFKPALQGSIFGLRRSPSLGIEAAWHDGFAFLDYGLAGSLHMLTDPAIPGLKVRPLIAQTAVFVGLPLSPWLSLSAEGAASISPWDIGEQYLGYPIGNIWFGALARLGGIHAHLALIEELVSFASIEVGLQLGLEFGGG